MEKKKPNGLKEHIVRVLLKVINIMNKINFPKANMSQIISHDHLNKSIPTTGITKYRNVYVLYNYFGIYLLDNPLQNNYPPLGKAKSQPNTSRINTLVNLQCVIMEFFMQSH
jgi:hypothetical protein